MIRRHWLQFTATAALAVMALGSAALTAQQRPRDLFERARILEESNQDLKQAIQLYERVLSAKPDRALAAQAVLRMAECYQKLGDAQARKIFEQVVNDYPEQTAAVTKARGRLGGSDRVAKGTVFRKVLSSGVDPEARVSPDGRYISYPAYETGDLGIHDLITGTDRVLTNSAHYANGFAEGSAFSRDGKQIAYVWDKGKERWEVRVTSVQSTPTTQPRKLFDNPDVDWFRSLDWSPDGKSIAAWLHRKDQKIMQVALISVADSSLQVLKSVEVDVDKPGNRYGMFFSPDGKYIAYDRPTSEQGDIFILPIDGSAEIPAVVHSADAVMGWSRDGARLLFTSDRTGPVGLWSLPFSNGKVQGPPERLYADIGRNASLGVTASGSLYVYKSSTSRDTVIAPIDLDAGKLLGPPVSFPQGFVNGAGGPGSWSPDGNYLAYPVPCQDRQCIAIRSVATGKVSLLTGIVSVFGPRWSPDGRSLLTRGVDDKKRNGWFQFDVLTGNTTALTFFQNGERGEQLHWSPDGKLKVYFNRSGVFVERDVASGAEREVNRVVGLVGVGPLSPDGQYFSPNLSDPARKTESLLLVPVAGGKPHELLLLTQPERFGGCCAWTPDSSAVIFVKNIGSRNELWLIPVMGGRPRKLDIDPIWMNESRDPKEQGFSLSPDGHSIAFQMGKTVSEVWALENFLPASKPSK
jgi:Tol biopolymer transport system component